MKRYTISNFIKITVILTAIFVFQGFAALIYMLFHNASIIYIAANIIMCIAGGTVIGGYLFQVRPSIASLQKTYNEFANGKTITLQIEPSTHMFLTEEEELINRLNELIDRKELLEVSNKQAEYLALQNQIHPHFLYNTLEAMRGDALVSGMKTLANVAAALSAFFRYTISDMQILVTVEEELENVSNYFLVQQYRFGENMKLEIHFVDDEEQIKRLKIPKLTLQPLVENSVYHGLETQENRGAISITFDQTEQHLFISVKDSGKGMSEKKLRELNDSLNETPFKSMEKYYMDKQTKKKTGHTGIALKNVSQRIKLLFGDEYGIYIFSSMGIGTNVRVTIPRQEAAESDV